MKGLGHITEVIYDKARTLIQPASSCSLFKGFQHEMNGCSRLYGRHFHLALLICWIVCFRIQFSLWNSISPFLSLRFKQNSLKSLVSWVAHKWSQANQRITPFKHSDWLRNELLTQSRVLVQLLRGGMCTRPPLDLNGTWEHMASRYLKQAILPSRETERK